MLFNDMDKKWLLGCLCYITERSAAALFCCFAECFVLLFSRLSDSRNVLFHWLPEREVTEPSEAFHPTAACFTCYEVLRNRNKLFRQNTIFYPGLGYKKYNSILLGNIITTGNSSLLVNLLSSFGSQKKKINLAQH
jgi:hypothetical protein